MSAGFDFPRWPEPFADEYRARGYWRGDTLGGLLRRSAQRWPRRIAVSDARRALTYVALDEAADRLASGLAGLGVASGDRVVVQLPNSVEFAEIMFALFRLGAIAVFALPSDRISEIAHIARTSGAKGYVIRDQALGCDYRRLAQELARQVPELQHVIVVGDAGPYVPFAGLYGRPISRPEPPADAAALVMLSGGSTAVPKLIARTHDDYLYSVIASAAICELGPDSVFLAVLPAGHNFTLSSPGILGALSVGGRVVMSDDPGGSSAFDIIEAQRITFVALVPSLAAAWIPAATGRDLSSLEFVQVGGAKLGRELAVRVRETFGCELQQVYGMSEGLVCYTRRGDDLDRTLESQGLPISPADELRVVDEQDRPVAAGTAGHLLVRGPYTVRGYLNAPEHNARAFTADGFYRTGDIVVRRPDGYVVVVGRSKDQVNRGGEKIAAEEIEGHLLCHPQVREAAVIAVADEYLGEASCAFLVPAPGVQLTVGEIKRFMSGRGVAAVKVPDRVRFLASLPKTTVGKLDKRALSQQASGGQR